jgi:hypothetical protein
VTLPERSLQEEAKITNHADKYDWHSTTYRVTDYHVQMKFNVYILALVTSLTTFMFTSCAPILDEEVPGLANQGILPLSTNDPYLGSNMFLAKEMEKSPFLHNFIKTHGAPTAIELSDTLHTAPHMVLFYPKSKEVYAADKYFRKIPGREHPVADWIIRGPYVIERNDYRELSTMELAFNGTPLFLIRGKQIRFSGEEAKDLALARNGSQAPEVILPPPPPPPKRKPTEAKKSEEASEQIPPELDPNNFKPLNSDQMALFMAKGFAERAENGDIIHTVQRMDETITLIAKWYSGDPKNGAEIATVNAKEASIELPPGFRVRIPVKLAKKIKIMPIDFK